ncbi:MAG: helix-turn-helix domain-containing protein [Nanoarchaeota archaeon]|nr:helix-turn-helix domain-containing protein [Nanoarchaeota archaeon]
MEKETPHYYAVIPANVRYSKNITPNAKLLYGEITCLCNAKGYCYASNNYFADLYGVSKISISKWINSLVDEGFIQSVINYKKGSKEILNRHITLVIHPIKENFNTPIKENFKENITSNNITSVNKRNIKEREHDFINEVYEMFPDVDMSILDRFISYWTEPNKSKSKMRFEQQTTWELSRRVKTWLRNDKNFNNGSNKTQSRLDNFLGSQDQRA